MAGAGDLVEQGLSSQAIVRAGETSTEAMQEKAAQVMNIMQTRLTGLQANWSEVTAVDIYTVHPLKPYLTTTILEKSFALNCCNYVVQDKWIHAK